MRHWILVLAVMVGCGGDTPDLPDEVPTSGQRVELPRVTFNKWTDFMSLQAALDDQCRFLNPLVADDSTAYPPLQSFWVIYDNENDVKNGDLVEDTYFAGDSIAAADFEPIDDLDAIGFKFPPPSQRAFLKVDNATISDDGTALEVTFGSPLSATLFVEAAGPAGSCALSTTFCLVDDEPCEPSSLSSIHLELSSLLLVKDITWNP